MAITATISTYNTNTNSYDKVTKTYAEGCVLRVWYDYVQVMSDDWEQSLYAEFWNEEKGCVQTDLWLTRAIVDATPEVINKAEAWLYKTVFDRELLKAKAMLEEDAARPVKGSVVRVVAGRTGKGTEGKVVVSIDRPYTTGWRSSLERKFAIATSEVKVKVAAANGKVYDNYRDLIWVWARNVELVDVPAIDLEDANRRASNAARYEVERKRWSVSKAA